jgi:glycosyltransferase involved in cell wall biosynthesis
MGKPSVSVFLASYNKGEYVLDAIRSVVAQTNPSWELWILENSNDGVTHLVVENELSKLDVNTRFKVHYERLEGDKIERRRKDTYITAWLLNKYYRRANGKYIFFLADDDLIDPDCFELMAGALDDNPEWSVVWAGLRHAHFTPAGYTGPFADMGIPATDIRSITGSVDCRIDGGQVLHRTECLRHISSPYYTEATNNDIARHCDGLFLEKLIAAGYAFYPIPRYLITHRFTTISVMTQAGHR